MSLFSKKKKRQQQEEENQQFRQQFAAQEQELRDHQYQFEKYKQEQADKEAKQRYDHERAQREEQAKEQERIQYEIFLEQQSRLKIADAEAEQQSRMTKASAENVRKLRELIRTRHQLDAEIWSKRGQRLADQDLTLKRMAQSDAILVELRSMVAMWEPDQFSRDEWRVAKKIKEGLLRDDKHIWEGNPPWYYK